MTGNNLRRRTRKEALKKGYEWTTESVEEQGNETEVPVLVLLMQTSSRCLNLEKLPKETVVRKL